MIVEQTQKRIARAVEFIERNLEGDVSLSQTAEHVAMSSWYFSRLFSVVAGQPFGDYVRRRRLTIAAYRLLHDDASILTIAIQFGFASQQSFTRAFTQCFAATPGQVRKSKQMPSELQEKLVVTLSTNRPTTLNSEPTITEISTMYLCGPARDFDMQSRVAGIPKLWGEFVTRRHEIQEPLGHQTYGACISAGEHGELFRYQAAVQVAEQSFVPAGFEKVLVPAGQYAVFTHQGAASEIKDSVEYIWTIWLSGNGEWRHRTAPDFEFYDERFDPNTGTGVMEIYVPVEKEVREKEALEQ